jgi:ornithine decarboxylase
VTSKIENFLARRAPETPCLVVDLEAVAENYRRLGRALPLARIHYAVKANPAPQILTTLAGLGSFFDAASASEIDDCLAASAPPENISFGNTIKKQTDIAHAFRRGVRLFSFDSDEELGKLAAAAPASRVYCRILMAGEGADWPLSRKFGCQLDMARNLMIRAAELGLDPHGVSFHVGSQQTDSDQWRLAVGRAAKVFSDLAKAGIKLGMINLGGGFPVRYRRDIPAFEHYAETIMQAMNRNFGNNPPEMIIEPGRCIAAPAGIIETEVVLVSRKSYDKKEPRWMYLDVGRFGGLAETMNESIEYPIRSPYNGGKKGPVVLAGPTCDGADILYEKAAYSLPLDLKAGDRLQLLAAGAYTTTYASAGFNGFGLPGEYYI